MMKSLSPVTALLLFLLLAPALGASGPPAAAETLPERLEALPLERIQAGQTGYGLTVFTGSDPERFEVEVLGVLRNTDPATSYVLARLTGKGLEEIGVASGMSGSPVYIEDRLVGAVAFAWPFAQEAIAGITPIAAMRSIAELPSGIPDPVPVTGVDAPRLAVGSPVAWAALAGGELPEDLVERELAKLVPRLDHVAGGARSALEWTTAGFGAASRERLVGALGTVAAGGGQAGGDLPGLAAGGPVAAVLIDGDLQLAATGTVTERAGDEVLAFGHSFLGLGPASVPMATAEIVTVLPSNYNSFKIANLGTVVGAFEQDQRSGIRGRMGSEAPMIPLTIELGGVRDRTYRMRLAAVPQLVPALVSAATIGAIESASFTNAPQGIDLGATFRLGRWGDLAVRQSFDGDNAAAEATVFLTALAGFLVNNDLEQVVIEGIEVELDQTARPRIASLVGAHAERTVVRPGDRVRLHLDFKGYRGDGFRRSVELEVPEDLPAGKLILLVGDGESVDGARLALEPAEPVTFAQALHMLGSFHSKRELVALQVFRGKGMAVAGANLPRLPGSIRSVWDAASAGTAKPLSLAVAPIELETLDFPVDGLARVELEVRRRQPLAPAVAAAGGADGPADAAAPPGDDPGGGDPGGGDADGSSGTDSTGAEVSR